MSSHSDYKPRIKFNGGSPVILCKKCSKIIRYLDPKEIELLSKDIKVSIFDLYCERCLDKNKE